MKAVIVGTAGHIDHGKSALVRALTGTDPDRLAEEKRRGITIDLGFANLDLTGPAGEPIRLGFVDVPGHERFVRNMLAGVGGIDLLLLIIAADESIKPQTREHFDICRLLGLQRGITVLTKSDLVDAETLDVVTLEVADFLKGSFLDPGHSPIVAVSSRTGAGLNQLQSELARLAAEIPAKDSSAVFRLPVDRVFSMKGFGTVVTGTLISGTVHKDQELEVHPGGKRVRVRGVQVHGAAAAEAIAGQRTALNLAAVETAELTRGMMLTPAQMFRPTRRTSVVLELLRSAKPLRDRTRVHFHAFTAETIAEITFLDGKQLRPGESGLARLKLDHPQLLLPGDRFIIRQFSPVITIGGGRVLDATEPPRRARAEERLQFLRSIANAIPEQALLSRIARRREDGLSLTDAVSESGWLPVRVDELAKCLAASHQVARFDDILVSSSVVESLRAAMSASVDEFHKKNPLVQGISKEELRETLGLNAVVFRAVLESLVRDKKLLISGELVHAAGKGVVLRDEEAESKALIERTFAQAGLKVPLLKEVLSSLPVDRPRAQKIVTLLLRDRVLVKLADELVFHRDALESLRRQVSAQKARTPKLNVGNFKNLFGITRKYAIPLLEYLDRERITRRVGDERVIL
ncbi:MAG TPA: selenocysteine-specific translation elongation factor [Terriglobales bacterium]|jgi:selenocysteine-specific elongation factor|nr:selenocysteine-specific translation elongation factor [Terriglobales bacterium]